MQWHRRVGVREQAVSCRVQPRQALRGRHKLYCSCGRRVDVANERREDTGAAILGLESLVDGTVVGLLVEEESLPFGQGGSLAVPPSVGSRRAMWRHWHGAVSDADVGAHPWHCRDERPAALHRQGGVLELPRRQCRVYCPRGAEIAPAREIAEGCRCADDSLHEG